MNYAWMVERLKQFDEVCTSWFERGPDWGPEAVIATERSIMVGLRTVRKILVVLDPGWPTSSSTNTTPTLRTRSSLDV